MRYIIMDIKKNGTVTIPKDIVTGLVTNDLDNKLVIDSHDNSLMSYSEYLSVREAFPEDYVLDQLERLASALEPLGTENPFRNTGTSYENDTFVVHSYNWVTEDDGFFRHPESGIEVSWYKWLGRGMCTNYFMEEKDFINIINDCIHSLGD